MEDRESERTSRMTESKGGPRGQYIHVKVEGYRTAIARVEIVPDKSIAESRDGGKIR